MASGVKASDDSVKAFNDLKLSHKYKYIIYSLSEDKTEIVVEHAAEPGQSTEDAFTEFREKLPTTDCRYAVFDFEFEKQDGSGKRSKICFFSWAPDDLKPKQKMMYSSSKDAIRKALVGVQVDIQANDITDIEYDAVLEKCERMR